VPHVFRRHAGSKQVMGFRRFMFHGVSMVRDEGDLACAALNCAGRGRWASRRPSPRAARKGTRGLSRRSTGAGAPSERL